ncbi:MAG TPA: hypothetical protein VFQ77_21070 [Pseudonocardiaceae bacterium]|nr:hypothetical protein [Pseudonocardiaceae bacterium]
MFTILLTICLVYLAVLGCVALVASPPWRRAGRTVPLGRHHWGDRLRAAGTAVPGAGAAR